ncbi:hypothetical protein F4778DRAFT_315707 [Xylariomycetidae sp. FL2044]|nr:hypothetical protein F4778DRAFT_315707 [Xylariomycetidae sp. FL2044]
MPFALCHTDPYNGLYPELTSSFPFTIRAAPGKGLGVFASRDLPAGALILREPAVLVGKDLLPSDRDDIASKLQQISDLPEPLYQAVGELALSETPQARHDRALETPVVTALVARQRRGVDVEGNNTLPIPVEWPVIAKLVGMLGRFMTNAFGVDTFPKTGGGPAAALFLAASRFNHSCVHNTEYSTIWTPSPSPSPSPPTSSITPPGGCGGGAAAANTTSTAGPLSSPPQLLLRAEDVTMVVRAARPIAAGEEITIDYLGGGDEPPGAPGRRAETLQRVWGFACECADCCVRVGVGVGDREEEEEDDDGDDDDDDDDDGPANAQGKGEEEEEQEEEQEEEEVGPVR